MIYFILFVSIANLVLGFATAWLCQRRSDPLSASRSDLAAGPAWVDAGQAWDARPSSIPALARATSPREQITSGTRESHGPTNAAWSRPKAWSDLRPEIRALLDRARYARSASDKRLAWESAGQLRGFAESWCAALQPWLAEGGPAGSSLPTGEVDATHVEMWVAQLETTLRNLGEMDPTESVDAVLDRVERELAALERNSPLASQA